MSKTTHRSPSADHVSRRAAEARVTDPRDDLDLADLYVDLALRAHATPRPYRAGLEARMRRLWNTLTATERDAVQTAWGQA